MWMLLVVVYVSVFEIYSCQYIITNVTEGTLKGITSTTVFNAKPYFSFKGIPYAKPPTKLHKFDVSSKKIYCFL
jgi:hypothetical protein